MLVGLPYLIFKGVEFKKIILALRIQIERQPGQITLDINI